MTRFLPKFACCLSLLLLATGLSAQAAALALHESTSIADLSIAEATEAPFVAAHFPGGNKALLQELTTNLDYPELAREYAVEGTVVVRMLLDKRGEITDKKIVRSLGFGCDEAALDALSRLPNWNAARRGGKRIGSVVFVPLRFRLR